MSQNTKATSQWQIAPRTKPQREYVENWNVAGDLSYAAMMVRKHAAEYDRAARYDDEAANAAHNIRQIAKRIDLLVRAMRRERIKARSDA